MCEVLSRRKYKNSIVVVLKIAETRTESELVNFWYSISIHTYSLNSKSKIN